MRKKKMVSVCLALSLLLTGVLCGCGKEKKEEAKENVSSVETDESSGKSVIENIADSTSLTDKIYADYLKEQRLCTISKGFRIIEPGVAKDNPNGLAGAVKYDFDGDKIDELVTFTFERNTQNGEDIRIDLLKISGGDLKVSDSKYLTEMLDISDKEGAMQNTIYFHNLVSMEIVTSEYNDSLYFGSLLTRESSGGVGETPPYVKSFHVFSVEENKIVPCIIASTDMEWAQIAIPTYESVVYAKLLPPSIRDTLEYGDCVIDEENSPNQTKAEEVKKEIEALTIE